MSNRLLSLLTEIENSVKANDPSPDGGTWDTLRIVNYNQGLARLTLAVRSDSGVTATRGAILLQSFRLADGSQCVKANLNWQGVEAPLVWPIYSKPETNWNSEASMIATKWLDGRIAVSDVHELPQTQTAQELEKATG
jgi:hypothetical protein